MSNNKVYVLHKQGAESHYTGLEYLLKEHSIEVEYREFSVITKTLKALKTLQFKKLQKEVKNFRFLLDLHFSQNKKIVLGIAPFDSKLKFLLKLLKKHRIFYHTSWACWDKTFHPKTKNNSPEVFNIWKDFLENKAEHIFCVTRKSEKELLRNYKIPQSQISPVFHALDPAFSKRTRVAKRNKSFIYYGRMVAQKGIDELLEFFAQHQEATLTLIGDGNQTPLIKKYAKDYKNILHIPKTTNKEELRDELAQHEYLILNARNEELFSLVVIESMSQAVIPISSSLTGPKEIIEPHTGYLFKEGEATIALQKILDSGPANEEMAAHAVTASKYYLPENISKKWMAILY